MGSKEDSKLELSIVFNVLLLMLSVVLGILTYRINKRNCDLNARNVAVNEKNANINERNAALSEKNVTLKKKITKLQNYARSANVIEHEFVDVVLLGPREAGKTSLVELWTSPWTKINQISASKTWHSYEADIHEFKPTESYDELFEVKRIYRPTLRVRVRDYPGEDEYRVDAMQYLGNMGNRVTMLFVFRVGFEDNRICYGVENSEYFSKVFVEEVEALGRIKNSIAKVMVVFNKSDLLPPDLTDNEALNKLKMANAEPIRRINGLFSGLLEYHLVSAWTNKGIIRLLGSIGKTAIKSDSEKSRFNDSMRKIGTKLDEEFRQRGI